jgi:hypothetical protein
VTDTFLPWYCRSNPKTLAILLLSSPPNTQTQHFSYSLLGASSALASEVYSQW